jgi:hypothetical protein
MRCSSTVFEFTRCSSKVLEFTSYSSKVFEFTRSSSKVLEFTSCSSKVLEFTSYSSKVFEFTRCSSKVFEFTRYSSKVFVTRWVHVPRANLRRIHRSFSGFKARQGYYLDLELYKHVKKDLFHLVTLSLSAPFLLLYQASKSI